MEELCPRAMLLNYANPMCMNMQTIAARAACGRWGCVIACRERSTTSWDISARSRKISRLSVPASITWRSICGLRKKGRDLYPRLFEAMKEPRVYNCDQVRFELMKRLGYFVTESSEHSAEYSPFFIPHGKLIRPGSMCRSTNIFGGAIARSRNLPGWRN